MKRFGATQALAGAAVELEQGGLLALLGPNGAGKTTLVRAIAGRVRLDAGEIVLFGRPVDVAKGVRDRLGLVPQEVALYPLLTARENLDCFGSLHGLRGGTLRDRVQWALGWTGLAERATEPIGRFSGGMKRRLNIACGVLHRPDLVLLDEPTVGVDPQSRERIWEMLDALRHAGTSILLTTHQLDEAQARCDRIVVIDHGRTIAAGTLAELIDQTVGARRQVTLTLDRPPAEAWPDAQAVDTGAALRFQLADVATELPPLLARVHQANCRIEDIVVQGPSLQAVFLHLTGRELRE
jgi:ABC-2 type transport system ATP-binding protein